MTPKPSSGFAGTGKSRLLGALREAEGKSMLRLFHFIRLLAALQYDPQLVGLDVLR